MALLQQFEVSLTASRRHFGDKMESDFISSQQNAEVISQAVLANNWRCEGGSIVVI
jgi:hypothetical protein